jgi:hypothetical protein
MSYKSLGEKVRETIQMFLPFTYVDF